MSGVGRQSSQEGGSESTRCDGDGTGTGLKGLLSSRKELLEVKRKEKGSSTRACLRMDTH